MSIILVGYSLKRRTTRANWVSPWPEYPDAGFPCGESVEAICSVSTCIARRPASPSHEETCNPFGLYDTPELALATVPDAEQQQFELFAYRLLLVEFENGQESPIEPGWTPTVAPKSRSFLRLGWDAVVGGNNHGFGCSPMSCNAGADSVEIAKRNRYCLVDTRKEAVALARHFSIEQPEPGPYCAVEVWRRA